MECRHFGSVRRIADSGDDRIRPAGESMSELIREVPREILMHSRNRATASSGRAAVLLAVPEADRRRLAAKLAEPVGPDRVLGAETAQQLREMVARHNPQVIVIDARILGSAPLQELLLQFCGAAHAVLVAPYDRQPEVARLIAEGQVDFVPQAGRWKALAASLAERRLRFDREQERLFDSSGASSEDLGEIFRHEINNPLTGILGNAELLLAHSDGFPPIETQRIRTVVELAVRLRETVRRVSNLWEKRSRSKSA
jgi:signal transduction histidine kinase